MLSWEVDVSANSVGFAVVGLGYWGPNLVRNLAELPGAHVVSVCDLRQEQLRAVARRYPGIETTTSFGDVLADDRVQAVAIVTPVSTHFSLASAALKAGKHVFVEKPLAASSEQASELLDIAAASGLVLMPGHTFLYSPPVMMIRSLIASGELGEIYFISMSRVNLGLHQSDVSVAWDLGPHDFSILKYWLNDSPSHVSAIGRGCIIPGISDVAFISLEFASGTVAHIELSWLAPSKLRRTTIVGSIKMVTYDDMSCEPARVFDSGAVLPTPESFGEYKLTYRTGDIVSPNVPVAEPLSREMDDFTSAIVNGTTPRSSSQLGLDVVRMIEAVEASLATSGSRVKIGTALQAVA